MERIASFTINHLLLEPGVYVSRKDYAGKEVLTTFDLRFTTPNKEPVMSTAEVHKNNGVETHVSLDRGRKHL